MYTSAGNKKLTLLKLYMHAEYRIHVGVELLLIRHQRPFLYLFKLIVQIHDISSNPASVSYGNLHVYHLEFALRSYT